MKQYPLNFAGQRIRTVAMDQPSEYIDIVIPFIGNIKLGKMWWKYNAKIEAFEFIGVSEYDVLVTGEKQTNMSITPKFEEREWEWEKVVGKV